MNRPGHWPCSVDRGQHLAKRRKPVRLSLPQPTASGATPVKTKPASISTATIATSRQAKCRRTPNGSTVYPRLILCICLHEDWEARGFYLYELNPDNLPAVSEDVIDALAGPARLTVPSASSIDRLAAASSNQSSPLKRGRFGPRRFTSCWKKPAFRTRSRRRPIYQWRRGSMPFALLSKR